MMKLLPLIITAVICQVGKYGIYIDASVTSAHVTCHVGEGKTHAVFPVYAVELLTDALAAITMATAAGIQSYDILVSPSRHLPQDQDPIQIARNVARTFTNTSARVFICCENKLDWITSDTNNNLYYLKQMIDEFWALGRTVGIFTDKGTWTTYFGNAQLSAFISNDIANPNYTVRGTYYPVDLMFPGTDYTDFRNDMGMYSYEIGGWGYDVYGNIAKRHLKAPVIKTMPNVVVTCGHTYGIFYY